MSLSKETKGKIFGAALIAALVSIYSLHKTTDKMIKTPIVAVQKDNKVTKKEQPKLIKKQETKNNQKQKERTAGLLEIQNLLKNIIQSINDAEKLVNNEDYVNAISLIERSQDTEKEIKKLKEKLANRDLINSSENYRIDSKLYDIMEKLYDIIKILKKAAEIDTNYFYNQKNTRDLCIAVCQKLFSKFTPMLGEFNAQIFLKDSKGKMEKFKFIYGERYYNLDYGEIINPNIIITASTDTAKQFLFSKDSNIKLREELKNGKIKYEIDKYWLVSHGRTIINNNLDIMVGRAKSLIGDFTANFNFRRLSGNVENIKLAYENEAVEIMEYGKFEDPDLVVYLDERVVIDILLSKDPKEQFINALKNNGISYEVNAILLKIKVSIAMNFLLD